MGIELKRMDGTSFIRLAGAVEISDAAELKSVLLKALKGKEAIRVCSEAVTELDVAAFQLLWAVSREAKRSGAEFVFAGRLPEPVQTGLSEIGLNAHALFD